MPKRKSSSSYPLAGHLRKFGPDLSKHHSSWRTYWTISTSSTSTGGTRSWISASWDYLSEYQDNLLPACAICTASGSTQHWLTSKPEPSDGWIPQGLITRQSLEEKWMADNGLLLYLGRVSISRLQISSSHVRRFCTTIRTLQALGYGNWVVLRTSGARKTDRRDHFSYNVASRKDPKL